MIYLVAIFAFLRILTGIGVCGSCQVKTQADFSVAAITVFVFRLIVGCLLTEKESSLLTAWE